MAYETKVIISAVADILETSEDLDEAYRRVSRLANAEGVVLPATRSKKTKQTQSTQTPNNPKEEQNA